MPSGHAVPGGQHKLSARLPAPLQALMACAYAWPGRRVPLRAAVAARQRRRQREGEGAQPTERSHETAGR